MSYLNVNEIETALSSLAHHYSDAAQLIEMPHKTHENRTTTVLRLGLDDSQKLPGVLVLGGVHAREWMPPDALVYLAADLLEAYQDKKGLRYGNKTFKYEEISSLFSQLNLYIFPCVNPDGRNYSQNFDGMWRKNRRDNQPAGNCHGVDINRNFDFLWDHLSKFSDLANVSSSENPCDHNIYRGPQAESEPETKNVVYMLDHHPNIKWHLDIHSHVPVILHSWGSDDNQFSDSGQNFLNTAYDVFRGIVNDASYGEYITADDQSLVTTLADKMSEAIHDVRGDVYPVEQAVGLYPTSGASDDYAFSRHYADNTKTKVYGFTVECGHAFQPPYSEAEHVIREASAGIIEFSLQVINN